MNVRMFVSGPERSGDISAPSLDIATLTTLRWLAVSGQALAIVVVHFGLQYPLPVTRCLGLVLLSVLLNIGLWLIARPEDPLESSHATALLTYDLCQLAAFLFFTGGLDNPFSFLLLAPVLVSAATLPQRVTWFLGTLVAILAIVLAVAHFPLPWNSELKPVLPPLYLVSIWTALLLTIAFTAAYAFRASRKARQLADALAATEMVLLRERHLAVLDGLAAAAAHELGTPLGTIAVVTRELERDLTPGSPLAADIALLKSQSNRCRAILRKLSESGAGEVYLPVPLSQLIDEIVDPFRELGRGISVARRGIGPEPTGIRNAAILHGLGNIIENAMDFAATEVVVMSTWDETSVSVTISDDGPGFHPDIMDRIGAPFATFRTGRADPRLSRDVGGGLGLGYFIASTFLERSGARVVCANRRLPQTGATVKVTWPRARTDRVADVRHLWAAGAGAASVL